MPVIRALVDGAILSLQDTCVYYPSCEGCFSRINIHPTDTARCLKCRRSYLKEQVHYRYRLSLMVVRNTQVFGVTVFGSCLNSFFGIPASDLQRLVEDSEELHGGYSQATLLAKAVKDCFVGRHFVFGIKVADGDRLFSPRPSQLGPNTELRPFIASQISLPCAAAPGCSVVSYYRSLLQRAVVNDDPCATSRPPPSSLLLLPSTPCSFNPTPPSCLCSPSQSHNSSLTPTPPWQQSLGVVTSSAEQDGGCSFDGGGGELTGRQRHAQSQGASDWLDSVGEKEHSEDRVSPPASACCPDEVSWDGNSFWNLLPSHIASPESPVRRSSIHTPATTTWPAPPVPVHSGNQAISSAVRGCLDWGERAEENSRCLSDSVAWEDMPFSESLGEFVCEAAGQLDRFCEKETNTSKENVGRNSISSHCSDAKISSSASHDNTLSFATSGDRALLDITNAALVIKNPNVSGLDLTESEFPVTSPGLTGEFGRDSEQQLRSHDEYNCSADLFQCSQTGPDAIVSKMNSDLKAGPDTLHLNVSVDSTSYPSECLRSPDFVPFSQSTPVSKRPGSAEVPCFRASSRAHAPRTHPDDRQESKTQGRRHMPKAWLRLEPRQYVLAQQRLRLRNTTPKGALNRRAGRGKVGGGSLSTVDVDADSPPTCRARRSVRLRPKSDRSSEDALQDRAAAHQANRSGLKQRLIEHYVVTGSDDPAYSERGGSHERAADTGPGLSLVGRSLHEQSDACDLSQDLFADCF